MGLAAPLGVAVDHKYIFCGLVFQGLKRTFPLAIASFASALIFAPVHPQMSFAPVFALGLGTAFLFNKTKTLSASIATHAIYNVIVVLSPMFWPQFFC